MGEWKKNWPLIVGITLFCTTITVGYILLAGPTPYHGGLSKLLPNVIMVSFGEEMMYRGIFFSGILFILAKFYEEKVSVLLAVLFSGIAFGIGHINNLLYNPALFTTLQIIYAFIFGSLLALLRSKTKSIIPCILIHGIINTIGILF